MYKNIDEKFKDASPEATVEKIQGILKSLDVSVSETWKDTGIDECYSMRLSVDGTSLGSNGKGVSKALARASGYAELMERLQSGSFSKTMGVYDLGYSDVKYMNKEEILECSGDFFEEVASSLRLMTSKDVTAESLLSKGFAREGNPEKLSTIPYYDACNKTFVYLPVGFVKGLYSTNGLAAGNSIEETIVQSFSEIMERYCQKKILIDKLTPPTIPDEVLAKYETVSAIIKKIKSMGYKIFIKDCSLGLGYPVVASVLIDNSNHSYRVNFASSPVFEIAAERTLTELLQGKTINTAASNKDVICGSDYNYVPVLYRAFATGSTEYPIEFFFDKESYPFKECEDLSKCSNRDLVNKILDFVKRMGWRLLLRDLSHLGFGTFRVLVPGVSESYFDAYINSAPVINMIQEVGEMKRDLEIVRRDLKKADLFQLTYAKGVFQASIKDTNNEVKYSFFTGVKAASGTKDIFLGYMVLAYIEWGLGNYAGAYKYINKASRVSEEYRSYLSCVERMGRYTAAGYSFETALGVLSNFYDKETISDVADVYKLNKNPFERFIASCDMINCESCELFATCTEKAKNRLIKKLNGYIQAFDNEKAFEKIVAVFEN